MASACASEYLVQEAETATSGLEKAVAGACDLAMLDADSPSIDGLGCLKTLRHTDAGRELPAMVVSERRSDDAVASAFEWGADDFLLKDCDAAELLARLRSVLRRRYEREAVWGAPLSIGAITLDPSRHLCLVRKAAVRLNPREFELLELLMRKAGRVLTRAYLLESLWGMSRFANTRTVDVSISRLRRALGRRAGRWVETIERYGYRFRDPAEVGR
jgi:DNA-binding response OmpR family regulator